MSKYIDADKLIRSLAHYKQGKWGEYETLSVFELESAIENFADTNEADVAEVKHGRWTTERTIEHDGETYCDKCGWTWENLTFDRTKVKRSPYCPNCGAKMDEVEE